MERNNFLISIVIPVYNTSRYLAECLDSVINQTYKNLEIVLVDDGSVDGSDLICDKYAEKDSRIIVLHQSNRGASQARNRGIEISSGDYIMFVDGDDWLELNTCEQLVEALLRYNVQSSMCAYIREYPNKSLPRILHTKDTVFSGSELQRKICGPIDAELSNPEKLENYGPLWGRLYPAKVVKDKELVDLGLIGTAEDVLFNFDVFNRIQKVVYISQPLYHYRKEIQTSVTGKYKPALESQWDYLYELMHNIIESNQLGEKFKEALNNRIAIHMLGIGMNCLQGNATFLEKHRRIKKALSHTNRNHALKQLPLKYMPIYWKAFFFSARHKLVLPLHLMLISIQRLKGKV